MSDKMVKARAGLILDNPFYGSLALRLKLVEDATCKTAWTDGTSLGFNPAWVERLTSDELKGVMCHEVMHCANGHQFRRDWREGEQWNIACDHAINPLIIKSNMVLPKGALLDVNYAFLSAETIYGMLPPQDPEEEKGEDGEGDGEGEIGEVRDAKGEDGDELSESEVKQKEQEWKVATSQAATQAKARGELPAGLDGMVDEIVNPKINWREMLRRYVEEHAKNDFSWSRPDRRFMQQGMYLPGMYSDEIGEIVAIIDTSGSIYSYQESLNQFASELSAILGDFQIGCEVIHCDTEVQKVDNVDCYDLPIDLKPVGGGGTSFIPPFEYLDEKGIAPACAIYFTDGYCSSFPDPPAYPVLWVVYPTYGEYKPGQFQPPFGDVVGL